jgi:hypothetical protein
MHMHIQLTLLLSLQNILISACTLCWNQGIIVDLLVLVPIVVCLADFIIFLFIFSFFVIACKRMIYWWTYLFGV